MLISCEGMVCYGLTNEVVSSKLGMGHMGEIELEKHGGRFSCLVIMIHVIK